MKIEVLINFPDVISFILAAPDLIGETTLVAVNHAARGYVLSTFLSNYEPSSIDDPNALPIRARVTAFVASICFLLIFFLLFKMVYGAPWMSSGSWIKRWSTYFGVYVAFICCLSMLIAALSSTFVLIVGNQKASRALLLAGATLFVLTRLLAVCASYKDAKTLGALFS